jgi:hypothetical protein
MTLPANLFEPENDHHLYAVWGTDGKLSTRCSSQDHENPPFVGPKVDKIFTDGEYDPAETLSQALGAGREEHDRQTRHAVRVFMQVGDFVALGDPPAAP